MIIFLFIWFFADKIMFPIFFLKWDLHHDSEKALPYTLNCDPSSEKPVVRKTVP